MIVIPETIDDILLLTFNHPKPQNPFNSEIQDAITEQLRRADADENIKGMVLYGGKGRSFSAGGDFKEIITFSDREMVAGFLNKVIDFYIELLRFSKPLVAAVDGYAIGIGFQVALCTDYRMGTDSTRFLMPELKNGVACTLGGLMTEYILGRFAMQYICYDCRTLTQAECLNWRLLNEIQPADYLVGKALEKAKYFGDFPTIAFRGTKKINNQRFIDAINSVRHDTIDVHTEVIVNSQHRQHMEHILKKDQG